MNDGVRHYLKIGINLTVTCVAIVLVVWLLPKLLGFFLPFVIGGVIAALANPIVQFLEKRLKIRRRAGSAVTIILVISAVALLLYSVIQFLAGQIIGFVGNLPVMLQSAASDLSHMGESLQGIYDRLPADFKIQVGTLGQTLTDYFSKLMTRLSTPTVEWVGNFAMNVPGAIVSVVMCLLSSYFFIAERDSAQLFWQKYMPASIKDKWEIVKRSIKKSFGGYLLAQLRIEIWMYLLLVVGLSIAGTKYVALVALGIAFLDLLPVFGTGTVLIPWAVIKIIGGDYKTAILLLILWGGGQLLRQLIQPHIVGDSLGMPTLPTLFLLYAGWKLGGVGGMIISVPVGIIAVQLYEAGAFDTARDSLQILHRDINAFRRYHEEDYSYNKRYLTEDDTNCRNTCKTKDDESV